MQISSEQVSVIVGARPRRERRTAASPVSSVEELSERFGVRMDEVRRFTEAALLEEEDPARERRVRELARRVADGSYRVDDDELVDMAERRAIADRVSDIY